MNTFSNVLKTYIFFVFQEYYQKPIWNQVGMNLWPLMVTFKCLMLFWQMPFTRRALWHLLPLPTGTFQPGPPMLLSHRTEATGTQVSLKVRCMCPFMSAEPTARFLSVATDALNSVTYRSYRQSSTPWPGRPSRVPCSLAWDALRPAIQIGA